MGWSKKAALLAAAMLLAGALCACGAAETAASGNAAAPSETSETFVPDAPGASSASGSAAGPSAAGSAAQSGPGASVSFTDDLGRALTVERPQRAAVLLGSYADIWCVAGGRDTMIATASDAWTQFDLGLSDAVVNLGGVKSPSAEALLACEPDFVLASTNTAANLELRPVLEAAGIPVAYFGVNNIEEYLRVLEVCTRLTGHPERYEEYGEKVWEQVENARAAAAGLAGGAPQTVLYLRASPSGVTVKGSDGNVLGEMLADLGCVNIADSDTSLLENLSMEAILAADPDKIFFVVQDTDPEKSRASLESVVLSNPAWQQLTAVQSGACYYMDPALYHLKPNARWGEAYENLVEILYG